MNWLKILPAAAALSLSGLPAQAQYYSPPPVPNVPELPEMDGTSAYNPVFLASDDQADVYGMNLYWSDSTPDDNLYVTRLFISEFGIHTGYTFVQIDCGHAACRHLSPPQLVEASTGQRELLHDITLDWQYIDASKASGIAMMRSCENAAYDLGFRWQWNF